MILTRSTTVHTTATGTIILAIIVLTITIIRTITVTGTAITTGGVTGIGVMDGGITATEAHNRQLPIIL